MLLKGWDDPSLADGAAVEPNSCSVTTTFEPPDEDRATLFVVVIMQKEVGGPFKLYTDKVIQKII
jgi:hypothetical protein